jgi:serine/threonine protein kinase
MPTWIGLRVEDCIVDELIAEGSFSWVYAGNSIDAGIRKAFKWAKHPQFVEQITVEVPNRTQAKAFFTGGVRNVRPYAERLLSLQAEKVSNAEDPALVPFEKVVRKEGLSYCQMPFVAGPTLRQAMAAAPVSIDVFVELAQALARLSKASGFQHHGDIKPDNIILAEQGLRIIDPGYFGPIDSAEGQYLSGAITTTCYYPYLKPDDLMATAICMWEAACKANPFLRTRNAGTEQIDAGGNLVLRNEITDAVRQLVKQYENVGHVYLQPLLSLKRPREVNPALHPDLELFLLKALRLKLTPEGRIDVGPGFDSLDTFVQAMESLRQGGVNEL